MWWWENKNGGGWTLVGLDQYNKFFGLVKKSCSQNGKSFDKFWCQHQQKIRSKDDNVLGEVEGSKEPTFSDLDLQVIPHTNFSDADDNRDVDRENNRRERKECWKRSPEERQGKENEENRTR